MPIKIREQRVPMKNITAVAGMVIVLVLLLSCGHRDVPFNPQPERGRKLVVVTTTNGPIAGFKTENGLDVFLGIPYAEPPVGRLRFASPRPVSSWTYVRPAWHFGPTCPQIQDEFEPASLLYQDEDCLSLNIWSPGVDARKRPVLVYIHGGGFIEGGTGDPLYNGEHLARRGSIVVVSINYRVAALGFLALDSFGAEFAGSGNLALQDQIAGLTWVRNNIARFGGDPKNITIMGESAGSACVMFHMVSPRARGLFQKAIAHSGAINLARTKKQAAQYTRQFMKLTGARDVTELRMISAERLVALEKKFLDEAGFEADLVFSPVKDGIFVPIEPMKAFKEGAAAGIPLLNGTNNDEYRYWLLYFPYLKYIPARLVISYAPSVKAGLGDGLDRILDHYRRTLPNPVFRGVIFALANDMMFRVPHIRVSDMQSTHAPVWMYRFDWRSMVSDDLGACHAIELPFVFRTFDSPTRWQIVGSDPPMDLSDLMMDTWIAFIRTGSPNGRGLPVWPAFKTANRATMIFNTESEVRNNPDGGALQLYEGLLEE